MLKDLVGLQEDIDFIKLELEKKLSADDKILFDTLIDLIDLKQKRLSDLVYIQRAEGINNNIFNSMNNTRIGGNPIC